ncbi:PadR family transcriptional regulator [Algihabitans albus]|uniref:PadR family transcriptional regulator n=1 Tax=Algihabitans albus TaxID=2164067 RepID=UPI000E5D34DD|nr:PadR family transcriptional regulator [Algihabitans albus]
MAVLQAKPASGYEIKKTLESAPLNHFQETSFGAIYPALTRLAEEGLVTGNALAQDKRPDKKVYSLTSAGREQLVAALLHPPLPDRFRSDFLLVLFLSDLLPQDHVIQVVDARIADLEREMEGIRACDLSIPSPAQRFVHDFGLAYYEFAADWLRSNRDRLTGEADEPEAKAAGAR